MTPDPPATVLLRGETGGQQILDKAKTDAITKWTADTKSFFAKKVEYATGFAPPEAATDTSSATTTG